MDPQAIYVKAKFSSSEVHSVCGCPHQAVLFHICHYFLKRSCTNSRNIWTLPAPLSHLEEMGKKILFCVLTDVQINIKRCLSDGCDTRIHGLRAVGYQRVKKVGVSVCDASAIWYWSLLTSLVTASMETNPAFVHTILQNTQ